MLNNKPNKKMKKIIVPLQIYESTTESGRSADTNRNHPNLIKDNLISFVVMSKEDKDDCFGLFIDDEFKNEALEDMDTSFSSQIILQRFVVIGVLDDFSNFFVKNFCQDRVFSTEFIDDFLADRHNLSCVTHFVRSSSTELNLIGVSFNAFFNSSICSGFIGNSSTGCQSICSQNSQSSSVTSLVCLYLADMSCFINLITALVNNSEFSFNFSLDLTNSAITKDNGSKYLNVSNRRFLGGIK